MPCPEGFSVTIHLFYQHYDRSFRNKLFLMTGILFENLFVVDIVSFQPECGLVQMKNTDKILSRKKTVLGSASIHTSGVTSTLSKSYCLLTLFLAGRYYCLNLSEVGGERWGRFCHTEISRYTNPRLIKQTHSTCYEENLRMSS